MNITAEKKSSCDIFWIYIPQNQRQVYMPILASFNSLIGIATCLVNVVTLTALKKNLKPQNLILINLSTTDLCTGLLVQPLYITFLSGLSLDIEICNIWKAMLTITHLVSTVSFLTLVFAVIDRYIYIFLPFRYETTVRQKKVWILIVISWISGLIAMLMHEIKELRETAMIASLAFFGGCCVFFILTHIKILSLACRVKRKIEDTNVRYNRRQNGAKTFKVTTMLILLCGVLFTPYCTFSTVVHMNKRPATATHVITLHCLFTLLLINPLLDPVCYCLINKEVRSTVTRLLHIGKAKGTNDAQNQDEHVTVQSGC